jgi:hypothetical protein
MLKYPTSNWQTKDFLTLAKNEFNIKQRQTIIRHLNGLKALGLIRYNPSTQSYRLPDSFRTFAYLKALNNNLDATIDHLVPLYPKEVQEEYYRNLLSVVENETEKKSLKKRLNIKSKREIDSSNQLLHTLALTRNYLNALDGLNVEVETKDKVKVLLKDFESDLKTYLIETSIRNLNDLHKDKRLPRFIRPKLSETITKIESD